MSLIPFYKQAKSNLSILTGRRHEDLDVNSPSESFFLPYKKNKTKEMKLKQMIQRLKNVKTL